MFKSIKTERMPDRSIRCDAYIACDVPGCQEVHGISWGQETTPTIIDAIKRVCNEFSWGAAPMVEPDPRKISEDTVLVCTKHEQRELLDLIEQNLRALMLLKNLRVESTGDEAFIICAPIDGRPFFGVHYADVDMVRMLAAKILTISSRQNHENVIRHTFKHAQEAIARKRLGFNPSAQTWLDYLLSAYERGAS